MKPLFQMFQFAFGCHHRQRSGVFTIKKRTYQVCLNCGEEFEYSWRLMHTLRPGVADIPDAPQSSNLLNSTRRAKVPVI
jgi:hypothetical protein